MYDINFGVIFQYWPALFRGYAISLGLSVLCYFAGFAFGLPLAVLRMGKNRIVRFCTGVFVDLNRGLPLMVRLIWIYFALPILLGYDLSAFVAAFIALSSGQACFMAEDIRAGITSVPEGQVEAARALGMPKWLTFRRIVFPQALRVMIPPLINDYVTLLKGTALAYVIGLTELMHVSSSISIHTTRPLEVMTVTAVLYLLLTIPMSAAGGVAARVLGRGTA